VKIQSSKDLASALLSAASAAASGNANAEQVSILCQCTDAIVKLARLEIEAQRYDPHPVPWLNQNEPQITRRIESEPTPPPPPVPTSLRIQDIESAIQTAQKQLKSASKTEALILEDKIQQWQDRIKFLQKTASKVQA
jgi:hypothetical protein